MIKRDIFKKILDWLQEDRIIVVKGARQTGKTTLLLQLKHYLEEKKHRAVYFSVDREFDNPVFSSPKRLIKFLDDQYTSSPKAKLFLFLDEFQYLDDPGLFLKVLYDSLKDKVKLIVSGSSSLEIAKTREFLTGRKIEFVLERFNFREFLKARSDMVYKHRFTLDTPIPELDDFYQVYREDLKLHFIDYINQGGYPEIVLTGQWDKKKEKLKEIIHSYITKDVVDFMKIENVTGFNNLIALFSDGAGSMINKTEIANTLGIDFRTLQKYMEILQHTFVFSFVPPFFRNIRKEISKMPKAYSNELGLLTMYRGKNFPKFELIPGHIIENAAFLHLKEFFNVYHYRTFSKSEIDFIVDYRGILLPIEIKFRKKPFISPKTHLPFKEKYNSELFMVVTQETLKRENDKLYIPIVLLPFLDFNAPA
ncbi:MAG: ATP-binding protein [Candidatus Aminicenantes bacterium]|nr:ATP-binding protein [Candidatus Aminicenantes bacterium]